MVRVLTDAKRDAIIDAAAQVFQEDGFEAASMAAIAARVGGSKSTLYRYYNSKEALFVAVSSKAAKSQLLPSLEKLLATEDKDLSTVLTAFGKATLSVVASEAMIKTLRTVISESGRSDIGMLFHEAGPRIAFKLLADFFSVRMDAGSMRRADPDIATRHLIALFDSETVFPRLMGIRDALTADEIDSAVERAVETFVRGYSV
ncbi:hypothetical protein BB779_06625 [Pseudomonas viridiflava]|nr:hypothetical protein BB779_06625 [Pseudomonas viridiflava]